MLLRVFTSRSISLNEASKPFMLWACGLKQGHVLKNFEGAASTLPNEEVNYNQSKAQPQSPARSPEEIERFRQENQMKIKGKIPCPPPIFNIEEANFPPYITDKLRRQNFTEPTPIQSQSWPIALQGHNMVGIARTGSGKTLAYMVPAIIRIQKEKSEKNVSGPMSLVLAPTRELALQIKSVADVYRDSIKSVAVYGGAPRYNQQVQIEARPDVIIATPGRLIDFLKGQVVTLRDCSYVVLDEADRMLDMGFEPQIREIMDLTVAEKQVLMWSATWPKEIQSLAEDYLGDYIHLAIGSEELTANPNIRQSIEFCTSYEKVSRLTEFLKDKDGQKVLIFTESKRMADELRMILSRKGFKATSLHGDKSQTAREAILNGFRSGRTQVLIATEIAARGLDVDDIEYVINYELPKTIDSYIHRIGRTARHEKKGTALSLMTEEDTPIARDLIDVLEKCNQQVPARLRELAVGSVRINFRERYAPRQGFRQRGGGFNSQQYGRPRRDFDSFSDNRRDQSFNRYDRPQFNRRRRSSDDDMDNIFEDNADDNFESRGSRRFGKNYGMRDDDRGSRRQSRDNDDMW